MSRTVRHQLPLLEAGQAQKEVTHNEAVQGIDRLLHPVVQSRALSSPPALAVIGQGWIVGEGAQGAWSGQAGSVAILEAFGWVFVAPRPGLTAWIVDERAMSVWNDGWSDGWPMTRFVPAVRPVVPLPAGGATVDAGVRQSFDALVAGLEQLGLIN